jgi:hypothetical protein
MTYSPCFFLPLLIPLLLPFPVPLYLLGNPPSCDRICPPWSPIACKLNSPFPFPCSYTPNSKIPTPRCFSPPNIHSLGWHRKPGSQDPVQLHLIIFTSALGVPYIRKNNWSLSILSLYTRDLYVCSWSDHIYTTHGQFRTEPGASAYRREMLLIYWRTIC